MRQVVQAITTIIRFVEGQAIETSLFFALASDSSTDRSANKQELVSTRTLREGHVCTAYLACGNPGMAQHRVLLLPTSKPC